MTVFLLNFWFYYPFQHIRRPIIINHFSSCFSSFRYPALKWGFAVCQILELRTPKLARVKATLKGRSSHWYLKEIWLLWLLQMASIIELQIFIYLLPKGNFKVPILANIDDVINLYLWIQEANFDVENWQECRWCWFVYICNIYLYFRNCLEWQIRTIFYLWEYNCIQD